MLPARAGRLITLEGGEGAGKSTLAKALAQDMRQRGLAYILTREPGGVPAADRIRQLLVTQSEIQFAPLTEALLFTAARNEHVAQVIAPALARGDYVICDRYLDSTRAYQAAAGGVPSSACAVLAELIHAPNPDLTLLLDLDPALGLARSEGTAHGEDRFEQRGLGFHQAVRDAFLAIAEAEPRRVAVIAAAQPPQIVLAQALAAIQARGWI